MTITAAKFSPAHVFSSPLRAALAQPNGARFYRCALQVNPFAYLERYNKPKHSQSEDEYNSAIIATCHELGIEVIAVTDHYRVKHSRGLVRAARDAKLHVFTGFEAVTKDGVHFLCLFDQDKEDQLELFIGGCGVRDTDQPSPIGDKDSVELLELAKTWGGVCIAAHVASRGGLLHKLSGQSGVRTWKDPNLLACALPGPVGDAPDGIRQILQNKDASYRRPVSPAVLNAADVNEPEDLEAARASCFIKMSEVSVEGLRQAFLDPESRIRLHSDPMPESSVQFLAITWEGGFLSDTVLQFNENLNVLVGGRGTGKSTLIESIRYVLGIDPLGDEAKKIHQDVIRHVLQSGTKISLMLQSHQPSERYYVIERSVPNPPVVKDEAGEVLALSPKDVISGVGVFGQNEISELTRCPEKLTLLLERFVDQDTDLLRRKSQVQAELERSRSRIVANNHERQRLDEQLAALPGLEETQTRFQQAGIEAHLKEKSQLVREERLFTSLDERIEQYRDLLTELQEGIPVDVAFVSRKALEELPNADVLSEIAEILNRLSDKLKLINEQFSKALAETDDEIAEVSSRWNQSKTAIELTYEKLLRELQKSKIDGEEFIQLRHRIEDLRPLKDKMEIYRRESEEHASHRDKLLAEWEDLKATEHRHLEEAAGRVSRKLRDRVQVKVTRAGNRDALEQLLREIPGNLAVAIQRLQENTDLSLTELAQKCREGKDSLTRNYNLPSGAAEKIAQADPSLFMRIEELELSATTEIELNTAPDGTQPNWQKLQTLSAGQKATAVLLLLLLESDAPLVIDQPEDNLDNRFITEGVVPIMREEKCRRQFVFSTHNANIPVLGDAELIIGLSASGELAQISPQQVGSLEETSVRELVEEILEGGKAAFERRRSKYGF